MDKNMNKDVEMFKSWQASPMKFIEDIWGLTPQKKGEPFIRGKNITWQQAEIVLAIEKGLSGEASRRIAVRSGNGIGKTSILSMLLLWFLCCFKNANVPCTAPSADQLYDALWKEVQIWLQKMPHFMQDVIDWGSQYVRMKENPNIWFARARTASKDRPEALSGIHAENVMIIVDEASGVDDVIYEIGEGAMTAENNLVILISNPTRNEGYFFKRFTEFSDSWQNLAFNSEESPIVPENFVTMKEDEYGVNSDNYKIFVRGEFPKVDDVDDKGYVPLLSKSDLRFTENEQISSIPMLGVDPSGEGQNKTVWVLRDNFRARIVASEDISNARTIAEKTITLMDKYGVKAENVIVDNFGVGADVAVEIGLSDGRHRVYAVNVGDKVGDPEYLNLRAKSYYDMRNWLITGGELLQDKRWEELLKIKYKRTLRGKVQVKSKDEMRKDGVQSPDCADALMLTFVRSRRTGASRQYYPHIRDNSGARAKQYYPHLQKP